MKKIILFILTFTLLTATATRCGDDYTTGGRPGKLYNARGEELASYDASGKIASQDVGLRALLQNAHRDQYGNWRDDHGTIIATTHSPTVSATRATDTDARVKSSSSSSSEPATISSSAAAPALTPKETKTASNLEKVAAPVLKDIFLRNVDVRTATGFIESIKRLVKLREVSQTFRDSINQLLTEDLSKLHLESILDADESNIIHIALKKNAPIKLLVLLLNIIKNSPELLQAVNQEKMTPLYYAIETGNSQIVELIWNRIPLKTREIFIASADAANDYYDLPPDNFDFIGQDNPREDRYDYNSLLRFTVQNANAEVMQFILGSIDIQINHK